MTRATTDFYVGPLDEPDKYRLRRPIGGGGEAALWEAAVTLSGEPERVAVKILGDQHEDRVAWRKRWNEQVELLRLVRHPSVVGVHCTFEGPRMHLAGEAGTQSDALYLVMNWIDGQDLRDWVPANVGAANRSAAFRLLTQVADVLDWLHNGRGTHSGRPVIHGDISPANVVVTDEGLAVLVDFGLVRLSRHVTELPMGTPDFVAPEVARGGEYSPASDRFSFGRLAYYVLTGERPPADPARLGAGLARVVPAATPETLAAAMSIFADDPDARPPLGPWLRGLRATSTAVPSTGSLPPLVPRSDPAPALPVPASTANAGSGPTPTNAASALALGTRGRADRSLLYGTIGGISAALIVAIVAVVLVWSQFGSGTRGTSGTAPSGSASSGAASDAAATGPAATETAGPPTGPAKVSLTSRRGTELDDSTVGFATINDRQYTQCVLGPSPLNGRWWVAEFILAKKFTTLKMVVGIDDVNPSAEVALEISVDGRLAPEQPAALLTAGNPQTLTVDVRDVHAIRFSFASPRNDVDVDEGAVIAESRLTPKQ